MIDTLFTLVSGYGLWVVAASAFLSCLALPIPTFAVMLAGGAFAATGDMVYWQVLATAFAAAVLGDQTGFHIGRLGGEPLVARAKRGERRTKLIERAQATVAKWGGVGVFFSTWLVAPLGPWVNLIAGAAGLGWRRFTLWDAAGEAIWVTGYISLGYLFGSRLDELTDLIGNLSGLVSAAAVTVATGIVIVVRAGQARRRKAAA